MKNTMMSEETRARVDAVRKAVKAETGFDVNARAVLDHALSDPDVLADVQNQLISIARSMLKPLPANEEPQDA